MKAMRTLGIALTIGLGGLGGLAGAANADTLSGTWSGSGSVSPKDGKTERVRCRITYSPQGSSTVGVSATCASSSTTIHQAGSLSKVSDSKYVGDF